jgi:lipopolysaccharide/colanic/teichoic acid biosynthesis glycosyltransferase
MHHLAFFHPELHPMSLALSNRASRSQARIPCVSTSHDERSSTPVASYFAWKDWGGRCLAALLVLPGLPLMLLTMLVVRLSSPGPAIYRQTRVGRHGKSFTMYKIRSMRVDAEASTGAVWSPGHRDPRVTRVGRIIRALHLDELPQLWNVLRGEMALIGPRPERPEFTQRLSVTLPRYLDRLAVRPGITGLAQINLPPDTDLDSVRRKLIVDLHYVQHGNAWLDIRIFLCTFFRLVGFSGTRARLLLRLNFQPQLPPDELAEQPVEQQAEHLAAAASPA